MNKTAKHKYSIIGFIYLFGLICASFLDSIVCFIIFVSLGLLYLTANKLRIGFLRLHILFTAAAFLVMGFYGRFYVEESHKLIGRELTVEGMVTEVLSPDNDTVMLTVSGNTEGTPVSFTLFTMDKGIRAGDRVSFSARFSKLTDSAEFSQTGYYYSKGILKILINIFFVVDNVLLYFIILKFLNNGIIHFYFLLSLFLGFISVNKVTSKILIYFKH